MKTTYFIVSVTILISCTFSKEKPKTEVTESNMTSVIKEFPSLIPEDVQYSDEIFGPIIQLHSNVHPIDTFFKVKGTQIMAKDSMLYINNRHGDNFFLAFSLPDFQLIKSFGRAGNGPGEFIQPSLFKHPDPKMAFYAIDIDHKVYEITKDIRIINTGLTLNPDRHLWDRNKICVDPTTGELYYVGVTEGGKDIFKYNRNDSIPEKLFKDLKIQGFEEWAAYNGYLGINFEKKRMVYAYQYFRKLLFIDMNSKEERIVNLPMKTRTKVQSSASMLGPENTSYYIGMSAQKEFVYLMYSGKSPLEWIEEEETENWHPYIYLEKFNWNGNPICKYKLDDYGHFCVDEKEEILYVVSYTSDDPILSYNLIVH